MEHTHLGWIHGDGTLAVDTDWPGTVRGWVQVDSFLSDPAAAPNAAAQLRAALSGCSVETITICQLLPDPGGHIQSTLRSHLSGYNLIFT
ncbi:MAG: hypothetical protein IJZ39_04450 [Oscillospiraceae bacterium]|nr:hypothetical protein [Oscillospiraceae bacterium]